MKLKGTLAALVVVSSASALGGTATITSRTYTIRSYSSSYPGSQAPVLTIPGAYTMEATNGWALSVISPYSSNVSGSAAAIDNLRCTWNIVWTPAPGEGAPTSVVLNNRWKYSVNASALGSPLYDQCNVMSAMSSSTTGLTDVVAGVVGYGTLVDLRTSNVWVYSGNVTLTGLTWQLQPNGTYTCSVMYDPSYIGNAGGFQSSLNPKKKQIVMYSNYDVQTTIVSVGNHTFTAYENLP